MQFDRSGPAPQPWTPAVLLAGMLLAMVVFHLSARPVWLGWDPDVALFLLGARNILEGTPYYSTPYVFNPANAIHPAAYPPGFPAMMVPILAFCGLDLAGFNALIVLCFAALLAALYVFARRHLSPWAALAGVAVVALNPFFQMFATMPYSGYPFLLAAYAGMLLAESAQDGTGTRAQAIARAILGGALIGFAVLVRTVGFLLVPALLLVAVVAAIRTGRHAAWAPALAAVVAVLVVIVVSIAMPHDAATYVGYASGLSPADLVAGIRKGLRTYVNSVSEDYLGLRRLDHGAGHASGMALLVVATKIVGTTLAAVGWLTAVRRRCGVFEVFTAVYAAFIVVYPIRFEPARYVLPIVPLLVVYAVLGFQQAVARVPRRLARYASAVTLGALGGIYAATAPHDLSAREPWPTMPDAQEFFAAIHRETAADAVILAFEPTTIAFYTGRRSAIWPADADADAFLRYATEIGATHVIPRPADAPISDLDFDAIASSRPGAFSPAFSNSRYQLLRLHLETDG